MTDYAIALLAAHLCIIFNLIGLYLVDDEEVIDHEPQRQHPAA